MKKILLLAILLLAIHYIQAQGGFNYQAALKQNSGSPIANQAVKVTIEIRQGSANGTIVHTETQNVTTSSSGIVNIKIAGDGGSDGPNWSEGPFYLGAKFDGVDGEIIATPTEISAVPFALYAETSGSSLPGPSPEYEWEGTKIRFENPDGTFGEFVDLKGEQGNSVNVVGSVETSSDLDDVYMGNEGDLIIVSDTGEGYVWDGKVWINVGKVQGPQGGKGDTGIQGAQGEQGVAGPAGTQGAEGPQGPKGDQGDTGAQGIDGQQGPTGPSGEDGTGVTIVGSVDGEGNLDPNYPGDVGDMFIDQNTGTGYVWDGTNWNEVGQIQGPEGPQGPQGTQGPEGPQGIDGPAGPQGVQGEQGTQGEQGIQGPEGPQGVKGDTGDAGPVGSAGPQGDQGPQGPEGPQGVKGDTGDAGPQGDQGVQGVQGPQGDTGPQGDQGTQGNIGATGPEGPQGQQGDTGPEGPAGSYTAGTGISLAGDVITNTGDTNASDDVNTNDDAGGDVSGTYSNLKVDGIKGFPVSGTLIGDGVLKFNGSGWNTTSNDFSNNNEIQTIQSSGSEIFLSGATGTTVDVTTLPGVGSVWSTLGTTAFYDVGPVEMRGAASSKSVFTGSNASFYQNNGNKRTEIFGANGRIRLYDTEGSTTLVELDGSGMRTTKKLSVGAAGFAATTAFINASGSVDPLLVAINNSTSGLMVHNNGGVSVGSQNSPPALGLRVDAKTDFYANIEMVGGKPLKPGGGPWDASSDRRIKKNILDYNLGLKTLSEVRPVSYQYNNKYYKDDNNTYVGVIAQELEEIVPSMVDNIDGSEYLKVDPNAFTYMLINAVKELSAQNKNLTKRVTDLEVQLSASIAEKE